MNVIWSVQLPPKNGESRVKDGKSTGERQLFIMKDRVGLKTTTDHHRTHNKTPEIA